jgi:hypothetical protein
MALCGLPWWPRNFAASWVDGLTPTPPYLFDAARQWSPSQLHFIIANGVKMTAMPAWKLTMSDQDIWSLVAFTHELRGISQRSFPCMRAAQPKPKLTAGAPPPAGSMTEGSGALTHRRHTKNAN